MDFNIAAGAATNLPKETVDKVVEMAVEKSIVLRLIEARDQFIEIVNEGTVPVIGGPDLSKVHRTDGTADITTLDELDFDIKSPDLFPVECGAFMWLKKKSIAQYPELKLQTLFENKIAYGLRKRFDSLSLIGDTSLSATSVLSIADGIATIAEDGAQAAVTAVGYTTSDTQAVLNAVNEGVNDLGSFGDQEYGEDLVLFASADFVTACRNTANKNYIGFEIADYAPLGLRNVVFLHGVPVLKRADLTGEKAILVNMMGAFGGYYGDMVVDTEHSAARRSDLMVTTFWIDFKWAFINSSSKAEGMVVIQKTS